MFPLKDNQSERALPFINILIILINTLILILQIISPDPEGFTFAWALIPSQVDFYQVSSLYPFITSLFFHGGLIHYLVNMWFLWIFGDNVEAALGKFRYIIFYLSGGIVASLIEILFLGNVSVPIIGASGAIAAVLGFYLIKFPRNTISTLLPTFPFIIPINLPAPFVLGLWFVIQLFSGALSLVEAPTSGGVAWWAHIGGFVYGMIISILFKLI